MIGTRARGVPTVFHIAAGLLIVAAIGGQVWQHRPAGRFTLALLDAVGRSCPAAAVRGRRQTVADGAHALDRWLIGRVADRYAPRHAAKLMGLWCAQPHRTPPTGENH